jgi:hypothetical protein
MSGDPKFKDASGKYIPGSIAAKFKPAPKGEPRGLDVMAAVNASLMKGRPRPQKQSIEHKINRIKAKEPHGKPRYLLLHWIVVPEGRRALNEVVVDQIASSMEKIGLRIPISVRIVEYPGGDSSDYTLVAGAHRLAATEKLGWEGVDCIVYRDESDDQAKLWEISENLHRAELTALERSEQIAEWIAITEKLSAQLAPKGPIGHRPETGIKPPVN